METQEVIAEMLIENTGRHFLDSGGAYGRSWQRNQAAVAEKEMTAVEYFEAQPIVTWDYGPTINVYHFLKECLDYNEKLDRAWHKWVFSGPEDRYINGCSTADEFIDQLVKKGWADKNDDWNGSWTNSYNGEDALSQVIQFVGIELTDDCPWGEGSHVLLSIHGGADVRGGYTELRAFQHFPYDSPSLFDNARVTVFCNNVEGHRSVNRNQMDFEGNTPSDVYYYADSYDAGYSWESDEFDPPVFNDEVSDPYPQCPLCGNDLELGGIGF